jgi:hypothetical protein
MYHHDKQTQDLHGTEGTEKPSKQNSLYLFSLFLSRSTNTNKLSNAPIDTAQPHLIKTIL